MTYIKVITLAILLTGLFSRPASAEADPGTNPFGQFDMGQAGTGQQIDLGGGSGLANSIASPVINSYDPNQVNYTDQEAADNSRKNAAATAGKSSGTGQAVHAAIGGTMIGIGTPMAASIDPVVKAAGLELIAKGITELAQSGADGGVKDKNNDQRDLLTQKANQEGRQATSDAVSQAVASNPELNKALADRGLNPENFARQVDSGEINSPESIMQALGGNEFSPEQMAAASQISESKMGEVFADAGANDPNLQKLGYDETNGTSFGRGASSGSGDLNSKNHTDLANGPYIPVGNFAANRTAPGDSGNKNTPPPAFDAKGMLAAILGGDGSIKPGAEKQAMDILGILKPKKNGRNIFQEATYHYRGWGKWRRKFKITKTASLSTF